MSRKITLWAVLISLIPTGAVCAALPQGLRPARWDFRTGYAYQYTNESRPNNFQLIPFLPSVIIPLTKEIGPRWARGKFNWQVEGNFAAFIHPWHRPLFGVTPIQFQWEWATPCRWKPYVFAGAGVLYANVDRRETRKDLNFNLQGGIGTYLDLGKDRSLIVEYRHIHLSNAGLHEDNSGMDTHNFLVGVSVRK